MITPDTNTEIDRCTLSDGVMHYADKELSLFLGNRMDSNELCIIDLSEVRFIEPTCLMYILAIIHRRDQKDFPIEIMLPRESVISILSTWRFYGAVENITQRPFSYFIYRKDLPPRSLINSIDNKIDFRKRPQREAETLEDVLKKKYLPIKILFENNRDDEPNKSLADCEFERWQETEIMSWLQANLNIPQYADEDEKKEQIKEDFPARIVFEAMMNAIRHPKATVIATASHILWPKGSQDRRKSKKKIPPEDNLENGHFTLIWWDNGIGIVETLRQALDTDKPIIVPIDPPPPRECKIVLEDMEGIKSEPMMETTDFVPNKATRDEMLLFAATCPRITRDPMGQGHSTKLGKAVSEDDPLRSPGMGLYILLGSVINTFGGSVAFRTGKFFMNAKKGPKTGKWKADYAIKITTYDSGFIFPGNIITIRLPIQRVVQNQERA